jgi:hypothetical protein
MPILTVAPHYPPGYGGDPYTPDNISVFYDLNWPDHAGILSTGLGLSGLGCGCSESDEAGTCLDPEPCTSPGSSPLPPTPPLPTPPTGGITDSAAACGAGWSIVLNSAGQPICQQNTPLNTPLTPSQAGLTPAQQAALIAQTGNAAVSLIRTAAGGPYTVAGTNLVYNPATGQLTTTGGANATALASSITPYIPMIGLALAALIIVPKLLGGK